MHVRSIVPNRAVPNCEYSNFLHWRIRAYQCSRLFYVCCACRHALRARIIDYAFLFNTSRQQFVDTLRASVARGMADEISLFVNVVLPASYCPFDGRKRVSLCVCLFCISAVEWKQSADKPNAIGQPLVGCVCVSYLVQFSRISGPAAIRTKSHQTHTEFICVYVCEREFLPLGNCVNCMRLRLPIFTHTRTNTHAGRT